MLFSGVESWIFSWMLGVAQSESRRWVDDFRLNILELKNFRDQMRMISVKQLRKVFYSDQREMVAVDDVSFEVGSSEVFGLLGPNGAGKTTMMRMILGLLKPDSGWAEIGGMRSDRDSDEIKRQVGFVSAAAGVYQWLTGREMLTFFGDVYGIEPARIANRIDELNELLQLDDFLNQRCTTLSTGQKQRLNLARALIHDPPVMMLDEPTLGLDVVGSQVIFDYIALLKQQDKAVILCTHRLEQAQRVCSKFGLLHQGKMVMRGTMDEIRSQSGQKDLVDVFIRLIKNHDSTVGAQP
jgi:ABC-2 type transport system ATP-binding protein/sodium transport system ATP-binding protein